MKVMMTTVTLKTIFVLELAFVDGDDDDDSGDDVGDNDNAF